MRVLPFVEDLQIPDEAKFAACAGAAEFSRLSQSYDRVIWCHSRVSWFTVLGRHSLLSKDDKVSCWRVSDR